MNLKKVWTRVRALMLTILVMMLFGRSITAPQVHPCNPAPVIYSDMAPDSHPPDPDLM